MRADHAQLALALDERDHRVAAAQQRGLTGDDLEHLAQLAVVDEGAVDLGQRLHLRQVAAHALHQPRVVDGDARHPAQRAQEVQVGRVELAQHVPAHGQHAQRAVARVERHEHHRAQAHAPRGVARLIGGRQVGDDDGLLALESLADVALAPAEAGDRLDVLGGHAPVVRGGAQLAGLLVDEEHPARLEFESVQRGDERRFQDGVEVARVRDRRRQRCQHLDVTRLALERAHFFFSGGQRRRS